ncbi:hypothetical protein GCM10010191_84550 [Actinomadura vinacea]|uniref:Protein kinase domain-containing protein n=1 Tax=Actinomadura vinacea TaxID=115336 RepID=A0ABN3K956_9ACTN
MPESQPLQAEDPTRLGAYELVGRLGSGGQGTVFLGTGPGGEQVAVKLLRVSFDDDETARARFIRETRVARQVARFCTAQVLDADVAAGRPYLVSEYVPGPALSRRVEQEGPVTGGALERLAVNTASALSAIHRAGIVHRDFKPGNVLLGPDGARVIDFLLSRVLGAAGAPAGGPAYMAPEQVDGEAGGSPADVFAWGATMTFAATGRPPFGSDSAGAVTDRVLHQEPDLGDLDGELRELIIAALDKDPAKRPTAEQVLLRLVGHDEAFGTAGEEASAITADPPAPSDTLADAPADGPSGGPVADAQQAGEKEAAEKEAAGSESTGGGRHAGAGPRPGGASPPSRRGRRRRKRSKVPAALAALGLAAVAGGGTLAVLATTADETGKSRNIAGPSAVSPTASASSAPPSGQASRPAADPPQSQTPGQSPSSGGTPPPQRDGGTPTPTGSGDGGDRPRPTLPSSSPVVLGAPDPQRYCESIGHLQAGFRSGHWYCVQDSGLSSDSPITMSQVCRSQFAADGDARLNGDAGTPADWDCYVTKRP